MSLLVIRLSWNGDFPLFLGKGDPQLTWSMPVRCCSVHRCVRLLSGMSHSQSLVQRSCQWPEDFWTGWQWPLRSIRFLTGLFCCSFIPPLKFCVVFLHAISSAITFFTLFSFNKKLTGLSLRELENGSRGGKLSSPLSWLQCSTLQLLSIIS